MIRIQSLRRTRAAALFVVAVAILIDNLIYGLVVPILPAYAASLGATEAVIGLLFGAYALGLLLATPVFGLVSDRVGRRGPMLWGLVGLAGATVLFAFATTIPQLMAARFLQGVAAAATWTAGLALLADVYPAEARGKAMGSVMAAGAAGLLLGPAVGGLLYELGGYKLPFLCVAGLAAADGVARALLIADEPQGGEHRSPIAGLLRDRSIQLIAGVTILGAAVFTLMEPILPLHLEENLGATPLVVGLLFGAVTLSYGIAAPFAGAAGDRWGRRRVMAGGLAATAIAYPLIALPDSLALEAGAMLVLGVTTSFALTPALPELADAVDRQGGGAYATVYALFNILYAVGMMGGPIIGGLLTTAIGLSGTFISFGVLIASYALLLALAGRR